MLGHLGDARGLIISLNARGFPMFLPYTHRWPMTHQSLHPRSKPWLHYLNREASCLKVGGCIFGWSWVIFLPLFINETCRVYVFGENTAHSIYYISLQKEADPRLFRFSRRFVSVCLRDKTQTYSEGPWSDLSKTTGMFLQNNTMFCFNNERFDPKGTPNKQ